MKVLIEHIKEEMVELPDEYFVDTGEQEFCGVSNYELTSETYDKIEIKNINGRYKDYISCIKDMNGNIIAEF